MPAVVSGKGKRALAGEMIGDRVAHSAVKSTKYWLSNLPSKPRSAIVCTPPGRAGGLNGTLSMRLLLAAVLAFTAARPAKLEAADRPAEIFAAYGLFGTWSPDCTHGPSTTNPRVTWHEVNGKVIHTVTFDGQARAVIDEVTSAEPVSSEMLSFTVVRHGRLFATVLITVKNDRLQVVRSVGPDGRLIVNQGVEQATGKPVPLDEMCAAVIS